MRWLARGKVAVGGGVAGLALLALAAGTPLAQSETPTAGATPTVDHMAMMATPAPGGTPGVSELHASMDQMMDAMHGAGASDRMHAALGPDGERLMEQCAAMMAMMAMMGTMTEMDGGGMMGGMTGLPAPAATPAP